MDEASKKAAIEANRLWTKDKSNLYIANKLGRSVEWVEQVLYADWHDADKVARGLMDPPEPDPSII